MQNKIAIASLMRWHTENPAMYVGFSDILITGLVLSKKVVFENQYR